MILYVRDDFSELLNVRRLQIDHVECENIVLETPQVDAQIVS